MEFLCVLQERTGIGKKVFGRAAATLFVWWELAAGVI